METRCPTPDSRTTASIRVRLGNRVSLHPWPRARSAVYARREARRSIRARSPCDGWPSASWA